MVRIEGIMSYLKRIAVVVLSAVIAAPMAASAQGQGDTWRTFAEKLEVGTALTVHLRNGQRFRATLIAAQDEALLLQPKTRVPVPAQVVPFADVASIEIDTGKGANVGKAIAIGASVAAGAFFGLMALAFAVWGD